MKVARTYLASIDNKKRITIRGASYKHYEVREYENGCIVLEPRELKVPETISARTLKDIDESVANFKKGTVSDPIDFSSL